MGKTLQPTHLRNTVDSILAFGFGAGLSKFAPGTVGTIAAVPLVWFLSYLPAYLYLTLVFVGLAFGIGICERVSVRLGEADPSSIVWDEIIGFAIAMSFAPKILILWLAGFFIFRFFDILKPWPIKMVERKYSGGFGIMLDDVIAGFFTFLVLQLLVFYVV